MLRLASALVLLTGVLPAVRARAAVVEASSGGFLVSSEAMVGASPDDVYAALVEGIGSWWDPEHTFSGDSKNLSLDAKPGGCFCETLPGGGGVRHLEVVYAVGGYYPGGLQPIAPAVDSVLHGQLVRLKNYVETWKPDRE